MCLFPYICCSIFQAKLPYFLAGKPSDIPSFRLPARLREQRVEGGLERFFPPATLKFGAWRPLNPPHKGYLQREVKLQALHTPKPYKGYFKG